MMTPLIKWSILEDDKITGVDFVAGVDQPAITFNFQLFDKKQRFKADNVKGLISGPLMVPNLPIYRCDAKYGEYRGYFPPEEVEKIAFKFMRNQFTKNFNIMHDMGLKMEDVYLVESFIIDEERGIKTPESYQQELPDKTWWGTFKVDNPEVIELVMSQLVKGFSVEGVFIDEYMGNVELPLIKEVEDIILNQPKNA